MTTVPLLNGCLSTSLSTIARMFFINLNVFINPNVGELFNLWYFLLNVPSPKLFKDLRTAVNETLLPTFHGACTAWGLLHDDAKWDQALSEAGAWQGGVCLQSLFVTILLNCDPGNPLDLWNNHKSRYVCKNITALLAVLKHHHFFWCGVAFVYLQTLLPLSVFFFNILIV